MNSQCDLDVKQVGNGWIVQERLPGGSLHVASAVMVFNSFADMCEFLKKHFKVAE